MKPFSTPQPLSQSAFQHRHQERQQQVRFLKLALPIALVLHGITIGGGVILLGRGGTAIDEVEVVTADPSATPDPTSDQMTNQLNQLAGGGGDPRLSLFQSQGPDGKKEGNNIAALGNPFAANDLKAPEPSIEPPQMMPSDASTEAVADDTTIDLDEKTIENNQKDNPKKLEPKSIQSNSTDNKNNPGTLGRLDGNKEGKDQAGDLSNKPKTPNAPLGPGNSPTPTSSNRPQPPKPEQPKPEPPKPTESRPPSPKDTPPSATPIPTKPAIAIVNPPQPTPKKGPKCIENCTLDEYLGAEGRADLRIKVDRDGNVIEATLGRSSGNEEVDRKALEYARTRKYQPSDEGFNSNLPITSQQEGSDFARQQEERRRQEQAERSISAPEPRAAERPAAPIEAPPAREPIAEPEPIAKPVPEPAVPAPPEPSVEPSVEPIVPAVPEPIAPPVAEPIAPVIPEPATPEPVAPSVAEPIAPEPVAPPVAEPIAPAPEPVTPAAP